MQYRNTVEFEVYGDYAMFTDPITKAGGEKFSYQVPTYQALKGVLESVYWKPTFIWYIDEVRVMNEIRTEVKGVKLKPYASKGSDLSYFTYLKNPRYQVRAHMEWNLNRGNLKADRNPGKHMAIANRMIELGGRRDIFLGTRECQAYVEPCKFGSKHGFYDGKGLLDFGFMYHGIIWPDEADVAKLEGSGDLTINFWDVIMKDGYIHFIRPQACIKRKIIHDVPVKEFGEENNNFMSIEGDRNEFVQ